MQYLTISGLRVGLIYNQSGQYRTSSMYHTNDQTSFGIPLKCAKLNIIFVGSRFAAQAQIIWGLGPMSPIQ